MINWRPRRIRSGYGWPVPRGLRVVSAEGMRGLVDEAKARGYSRYGGGDRDELSDLSGHRYLLQAMLPESTPEKTWICLVAKVPDNTDEPRAPDFTVESRLLDVRCTVYKRLPALSEFEKDQLLSDVMWSVRRSEQRGRARGPVAPEETDG